jgi:hypothetical protein
MRVCPVLEAALERRLGTRIDILDREAFLTACTRRMWSGWLRLGSGWQRSMMRDLSKWMWVSIRPRAAEAPLRVVHRRLGRDAGLDGGDPAGPKADVDQLRSPGDNRHAGHLRTMRSSMDLGPLAIRR